MKTVNRISIVVILVCVFHIAIGQKEFAGRKISIHIEWFNKVGHNISDIKLNIKLTNDSSLNQQILFDKPNISTGGPWGISASVTNENGKSILKYSNKAVLSSQIYTADQLSKYYYTLSPLQSISRQYELSDIVIFNDEPVEKGTYTIQLFYYDQPSNKLEYIVR